MEDFNFCYTAKKSDTCEIRTHAGEPTGLAGQRLNHSAKVSTSSF